MPASAASLKAFRDTVLCYRAVKQGFEAMRDGKMSATVECTPLHGPLVFDAIEEIVRDEKVEKHI